MQQSAALLVLTWIGTLMFCSIVEKVSLCVSYLNLKSKLI